MTLIPSLRPIRTELERNGPAVAAMPQAELVCAGVVAQLLTIDFLGVFALL